MKYVLVTGGVISGIGKGVVASSVGVILKHCNVPATRYPSKVDIFKASVSFISEYYNSSHTAFQHQDRPVH